MLVIFDCDGVLVDSERLSCAALRDALAELGVALTLGETMAEFLGRSRAHMLARSQELSGAPLPAGWAAGYDARRDAAFARELQAVPGVADAVDAVEAAGHATCVASSGDHRKMRLTLGMTGLYARFEGRIFSATEVGVGKPAPDLFEHAAARSGFAPEHCVVVEDSHVGVAAARAAGMRVLGYGVEADVTFASMRQLPALIVPAG
ncbi:MAG: HAD-IA family hydrolase [Solirubrobacteraceae bacterium]